MVGCLMRLFGCWQGVTQGWNSAEDVNNGCCLLSTDSFDSAVLIGVSDQGLFIRGCCSVAPHCGGCDRNTTRHTRCANTRSLSMLTWQLRCSQLDKAAIGRQCQPACSTPTARQLHPRLTHKRHLSSFSLSWPPLPLLSLLLSSPCSCPSCVADVVVVMCFCRRCADAVVGTVGAVQGRGVSGPHKRHLTEA